MELFVARPPLGTRLSLGEGLGSGSGGWWWPCGFPVENEENGEKDATPYKSLRGLRARSPPRSARESVPEKRGVPGSV